MSATYRELLKTAEACADKVYDQGDRWTAQAIRRQSKAGVALTEYIDHLETYIGGMGRLEHFKQVWNERLSKK
jgi:hypothetical protein